MSTSQQIQQYGRKFPLLLRTPSPKGQVELIETVGKGNYGYVYKGRLINSNEISAIKVVFLKEDELKETLLEMEILKACNHPNITKYMGLFLKGLDLWICMEFCGGGALDSIYRAIKKPFTEDQIASIIYESIVGLEYLHNQVALIHRDIKAGNLLLTEQGELKLADFGVSAKLKSPQGTARTFIGTPYWMAPEVISCDPESASSQSAHYDCKADIWSIGITAIEIADKNPPLSDIHPMRALHLIPSSNLGLAKPKNWTKVFVDFIASCLVKDPVKRPSAKEILQHPFMQK
ncbi:kinase-like domain-containing protein, partial [Obelidium mucronatum]